MAYFSCGEVEFKMNMCRLTLSKPLDTDSLYSKCKMRYAKCIIVFFLRHVNKCTNGRPVLPYHDHCILTAVSSRVYVNSLYLSEATQVELIGAYCSSIRHHLSIPFSRSFSLIFRLLHRDGPMTYCP